MNDQDKQQNASSQEQVVSVSKWDKVGNIILCGILVFAAFFFSRFNVPSLLLDSFDVGGERAAFRLNQERLANLPPLHKATRTGNIDQVKTLLESGAESLARDPAFNSTPLGFLLDDVKDPAESAGLEIVKLFFSKGVKVTDSLDTKGTTLLDKAIKNKDKSLMKFLLDQGVDPNRPGESGTLPVTYAVQIDRQEMAGLLLSRGAVANATGTNQWEYGGAPLHFAKTASMVFLLIAHGANVNQPDDFGRRPLHIAARSGEKGVALVKTLLQKGADPNALDFSGENSLHAAVRNTYKFTGIPSLQILVKGGGDLSIRSNGWFYSVRARQTGNQI
ncbi:MAG: ankyrin repeat domain-containing protein [Candidatus Riflebacteria bacterium]|nr:ankyrin repeat domain-containing protein [Candidatus Riflebacteria bacterium]